MMGLFNIFSGKKQHSKTKADTPETESVPDMVERVKQVVDEAFAANRQRTRLTCWYCDRAIDEGKGYSTWLGVRLHMDCSDEFRAKMKPVLATLKEAHSNYLWDGMPVFTVEPRKELAQQSAKNRKPHKTDKNAPEETL